jgi:hypothetical protein
MTPGRENCRGRVSNPPLHPTRVRAERVVTALSIRSSRVASRIHNSAGRQRRRRHRRNRSRLRRHRIHSHSRLHTRNRPTRSRRSLHSRHSHYNKAAPPRVPERSTRNCSTHQRVGCRPTHRRAPGLQCRSVSPIRHVVVHNTARCFRYTNARSICSLP